MKKIFEINLENYTGILNDVYCNYTQQIPVVKNQFDMDFIDFLYREYNTTFSMEKTDPIKNDNERKPFKLKRK